MSKNIYVIFGLVTLIFSKYSFSQESHSIYQNHSFRPFDRYVYQADERFHTSVKPYQMRQVNQIISIDTLYKKEVYSKFTDIVFNRSLIQFENDDLHFTIDPLVNFQAAQSSGSEYDDKLSWINTRGILVNAKIGENVSVSTSFYENQASFNDYRYDRILENGQNIIPGQGLGKAFGDSLPTSKDYAWAEAYVSITPNKYFNLQLGHGKHFFGDGYRSLLLSDNSFNYPFLKITTDVWNIKYVNLWAQFQDLKTPTPYEIAYHKKWGSFHYLDWSVTPWLNIAFFEAIIWNHSDSTGTRGFDFNYANPVIFTRPVEFSVGSPDNALMGMSGKLTLFKNQIFYGQFMLDEFKFSEIKARNGWWANKWAIQAGYKTYNLFKVKNLDIQTELNIVRPFMYSHLSSHTNYGHYNQPLAHPLGSNFIESVSILRYNYKRIFFEGKLSVAKHGRDTANLNYGNNIWISYEDRAQEYNNALLQSEQVDLSYLNLQLAYLINPSTNLNIYVGYTRNSESSGVETKNQSLITFGLRTSLGNFYYDY